MGAHAKLAPSGASRWMPCPGSIALCAKVPTPETNEYAKEGTAAHTLAEMCLTAKPVVNWDAKKHLGLVIEVEGTKFTVTEEMAEAVQVYLDAIKTDLEASSPKAVLSVEKKFNLCWLCKDMFGTNDCSIYDPESKLLRVYDYKHGAGTRVDVEWNPQLLIYGVGALYDAWDFSEMLPVGESVGHVEIVIVQPRMEHEDGYVRRQMISTENLWYWALHVLQPAAERTEEPKAKLCAGDHCKFCDASGIPCPEKVKQACALAKTDFDKPMLPAPEQITPEQQIAVRDKLGMFSKWAEQVDAYMLARMQQGVVYPGYKLVLSTKHRIWSDGGAGIAEVLGDEAYKAQKVITPAQAEKKLKKLGRSPEAELEGLWEKPEGFAIMVAATDRRAEIAAPSESAASDFEAEPEPSFLG